MFLRFHGQRTPPAAPAPPPQPTGQRYSAGADGTGSNYLRIAPADFDLEVAQWHGFFWVYFEDFPSISGNISPIISQYNDVADDSAFATGVINLAGDYLFALGTCREVFPIHIFDNTLAYNFLANHGTLQVGTWYFVDFKLDTVASEVTLRVNALTDGTDVTSVADLPSCVSTVDLTTFVWDGGPHPTVDPLYGRLGGTAFRKGSMWSDEEIAYIYNMGCQILYGEIDTGTYPGIFDDLYAWWDMQDSGGVDRVNAEGTVSRDLLQVGTVTQECGTCYVCGG